MRNKYSKLLKMKTIILYTLYFVCNEETKVGQLVHEVATSCSSSSTWDAYYK